MFNMNTRFTHVTTPFSAGAVQDLLRNDNLIGVRPEDAAESKIGFSATIPGYNYDLVYSILASDNYQILFTDIHMGYGVINEDFWANREAVVYDYLETGNRNINNGADDVYLEPASHEIIEKTQDSISKIRAAAEAGDTIVIWYESNGNGRCDFEFVVSQLSDIDCDIIEVRLPARKLIIEDCDEDAWKTNDAGPFYYWGHLEFADMTAEMKDVHVMTSEEKEQYITEWEVLGSHDYDLRIEVSGELIGMNSSEYDSEIINDLPYGEFVKSDVVMKLFQEYSHKIDEVFFWSNYIDSLVERGVLERLRKHESGFAWDCILRVRT